MREVIVKVLKRLLAYFEGRDIYSEYKDLEDKFNLLLAELKSAKQSTPIYTISEELESKAMEIVSNLEKSTNLSHRWKRAYAITQLIKAGFIERDASIAIEYAVRKIK
jgi:hypothetical protein